MTKNTEPCKINENENKQEMRERIITIINSVDDYKQIEFFFTFIKNMLCD